MGENNSVSPHEKPRFLGNIDFNNESEVESVLETFENDTSSKTIETACVIKTNGDVFECYGIRDRVWVDVDIGDGLYGAIVSHNHPASVTEYSFSEDDPILFEKYNLKELRGFDEKYRYVLTNADKSVDAIPEEWDTIENFQHSCMIRRAVNHGYGYRRYER